MKDIEDSILRTCARMIDSDGVESVSVRKLVDAAGCSLRSLYNKFENLGSVYRVLIDSFTSEIGAFVASQSAPRVESDEDLYSTYKAFVSYFLEHPNRFSFLYLYNHGSSRNESLLYQSSDFQNRIMMSYAYLLEELQIDEATVDRIHRNIVFGAIGILTLHFMSNYESDDILVSSFRSFFFDQLEGVRTRRPIHSDSSAR